MKKATKVLAILATVLILLATAGSLCLAFLDVIMAVPEDASLYHLFRLIPVQELIEMSLTLLIGALICFTAANEKVGMWSDIVLPAAIMSVVPAAAYFVQYLLMAAFSILLDVDLYYYYYWGSEKELLQIGQAINYNTVSLGFGLLLVACGMSIAYKHLTRKQEKELCAGSEEQIFPDAV